MLYRVERREWLRVLLFASAIMLLTTIPYLVAASAQNKDWRFSGFMFGADDGNSYLAKMRLGANGAWLFHDVYTSEPHAGAFVFVPYLALGKISALVADPKGADLLPAMLITFHLARILFGILAILVSYRFVALFMPRGSMRWVAIVLICLGGGLGWLLVLLGRGDWLGSAPIDFYLPEAYTFYVLYGLPHLALARAALLGGFILLFRGGPLRWLAAGLCWLVMGLCVPFYITVVYALLGVWGLGALLRMRRFPTALFVKCVVAAFIPLPYLIYNALVFATNPIMGAWSNQNKLPSPHPLQYLLGFGVLAVLALPALRWAWRRGKHQIAYLLLPAWVIAAPLLAYIPVSVQRRLLEGIFVPLCILAVVGLRYASVPRFRRRRRPTRRVWRWAVGLLMLIVLPSSLLLLLLGMGVGAHPQPPLYHTADEQAVTDWLNTHAEAGAVILSEAAFGNYLPAAANLRAFVGHGPETIGYDAKREIVRELFEGGCSTNALHALTGDPVRYVVVGPTLSLMRPECVTNASAVFKRGPYTVYEAP